MIFLLLATYPVSTSTVTSSFSEKKKNQRFRKHFFFFISSALLWKWKSLMIFSLSCYYNNDMTYNWPNSAFFNFQRMQIKRIADNIRAFSFLLTNWNKEPDEERIYRWTEFFHKLDNTKWKMRTGARVTKQNYMSIYISLYMKTFLKMGV